MASAEGHTHGGHLFKTRTGRLGCGRLYVKYCCENKWWGSMDALKKLVDFPGRKKNLYY